LSTYRAIRPIAERVNKAPVYKGILSKSSFGDAARLMRLLRSANQTQNENESQIAATLY
jgi:hypothetical protein